MSGSRQCAHPLKEDMQEGDVHMHCREQDPPWDSSARVSVFIKHVLENPFVFLSYKDKPGYDGTRGSACSQRSRGGLPTVGRLSDTLRVHDSYQEQAAVPE